MIKLDGVLVRETKLGSQEYEIINKNDTLKLDLSLKNKLSHSIVSWYGDKMFIAKQGVLNERGAQVETRAVKLDLKGKVIDTLYEPSISEGEYIESLRISMNNKYLLVVTRNYKNGDSDYVIWNSPITLKIIDLQTTKIIYIRNNLAMSLSFELSHSPFSFDENYLVYSIKNMGNNIEIAGAAKPTPIIKEKGIYLVDVKKGQEKFITNGSDANFAPNRNDFSFVYEDKIFLYSLSLLNQNILYKIAGVYEMRWYPNGNYLYVQSQKRILFSRGMKFNEILIDVDKKEETSFTKYHFAYTPYFWKSLTSNPQGCNGK